MGMERIGVELQVCMDHWQWTLQPHHLVRVWRRGRAGAPLAELPVPLLVRLIAHYLAQAQLTADLLPDPAPRPLKALPGRAPRLQGLHGRRLRGHGKT